MIGTSVKRSVWRYEIHPLTTQRIQMPVDADVLYVAEHPPGEMSLWALVDTHAEREMREFTVAGTGWEIVSDDPKHLGSIVFRDGLVFHVFETTDVEIGERDA